MKFNREDPRAAVADSLDMQLPVLTTAISLTHLDTYDIVAPDDPEQTTMLVGDMKLGKWRAVLLPPGTVWKLEMRRRRHVGRVPPLHS